jgi:hypothetical protein
MFCLEKLRGVGKITLSAPNVSSFPRVEFLMNSSVLLIITLNTVICLGAVTLKPCAVLVTTWRVAV